MFYESFYNPFRTFKLLYQSGMFYKSTMLQLFNRNTIVNHGPSTCGVYYLRGIADEFSLYPVYYIGVANHLEMRKKLLEHFFNENWTEIVYFNYIECDTIEEARHIAQAEIKRHKPKYNSESAFMNQFMPIPEYKYSR